MSETQTLRQVVYRFPMPEGVSDAVGAIGLLPPKELRDATDQYGLERAPEGDSPVDTAQREDIQLVRSIRKSVNRLSRRRRYAQLLLGAAAGASIALWNGHSTNLDEKIAHLPAAQRADYGDKFGSPETNFTVFGGIMGAAFIATWGVFRKDRYAHNRAVGIVEQASSSATNFRQLSDRYDTRVSITFSEGGRPEFTAVDGEEFVTNYEIPESLEGVRFQDSFTEL